MERTAEPQSPGFSPGMVDHAPNQVVCGGGGEPGVAGRGGRILRFL
ncbi:MAG: hypothetical protein OXH95_04900 [bacterium]|nr:hypothetical protein [bacterium]